MFNKDVSYKSKLYIVVGVMGTGKTTVTKKLILEYAKTQRRNVLIFDINNEYAPIAKIDKDEVYELFNKPSDEPRVRRITAPIVYDVKNGEDPVEETAITMARDFQNGLLVFEDFGQYMSDVRKRKIYSSLLSVRHKGVDLIFIYHSLGDVPKKLRNLASIYRIHFTYDNLSKYADRFFNYQLISIAGHIVQNRYYNGDKYAYVYADISNNKLFGKFSSDDFLLACKKTYEILKIKEDFNSYLKKILYMLGFNNKNTSNSKEPALKGLPKPKK